MLLAFVLCFCITSLLALDDGANILSMQGTSSQAPPINVDSLPLELYETYNMKNVMRSSNPLHEEIADHRRTFTRNCPNTDILLKIFNILTNVLQESRNVLEPGKLQYVLSIIRNLLEKSLITDENHNLNIDLNNLDVQLDKENTLRQFQTKDSLQYEVPRSNSHECQYIFNVLVNFINNLYAQVAKYCQLTGKCHVNSFPFFNFDKFAQNTNPYNQHNILSQQNQRPPSAMGYLPTYNYYYPNFEKGNYGVDEQNQATKQNYHLILQNYLKQLLKNNAQNSKTNAYPLGNPKYNQESQGKYGKYQVPNLFTDSNKQAYGPKGIHSYPRQVPGVVKGTPDFNTLSNTNENYAKMLEDILHSNNNAIIVNNGSAQSYGYNNLKEFPSISIPDKNSNQNYEKELDVLRYNNSIPVANYSYNNLNNDIDKQKDGIIKYIFELPNYQNYNLHTFGTSNNAEKSKMPNSDAELSKFGLQKLIYNNVSPTNTQENERKQFSHIANENIISKVHKTGDNQFDVRNPVDNDANPILALLNYHIQNNEANAQEQINSDRPAEVITKTNFPQESANDQNVSRYWHIFKQLLNQKSNAMGLNQVSQDTLTVPNMQTSQSSYVSPNVISTIIPDNNKHENYGTQLPDSSHSLGVSNLIKLNAVSGNNRILELTYKLKRTKAIYEPLYYVKYRIPYDDFLYSLQNLLKQKPYLRNQPNQIYEELLSGSNVIEASGNLKDLNRDELVKLTFDNGTLIGAKVLENDGLKADKQLKMIQDLNANLSYANLVNFNESSAKPLKSIENLFNTTISSGFDGSLKSNVYPLADLRRLSVNGYTNPVYNTPVAYPRLSYNYNPYSNSINPAYSAYYVSPSRYTYNTLSKGIVRNMPSNYNLVNSRLHG